ncbi:hypothetical protein MTR67_045666 [Solanum verrucosum]|uniref:F-box/LRR-repeat protein 15/At3g58940/PEG3-like LRR domain-containing protein n=1 Tax=Solanum verrucosum TaxID=315347 RepID=A0AAF0UVW6_SOLVR|nr:hypothetical protein MTR67_045666 [Solanum verrucosum]
MWLPKTLIYLKYVVARDWNLLDLGAVTITRFDPRYQKFPCLRFLSVCRVKISTLNLSCWLSACPKVEVLNLVAVDLVDTPEQCGIFAEFTNFIMTVLREYKYLQVQFLCLWI